MQQDISTWDTLSHFIIKVDTAYQQRNSILVHGLQKHSQKLFQEVLIESQTLSQDMQIAFKKTSSIK